MSGKDLLLDFVSYLFLVGLIVFFVFYIIIGNRLGLMMKLMVNLVPIGVFGIVFVAMILFRKSEVKKRRKYGDTEISIVINVIEKFIIDFIVGVTPVAVLVVGLITVGDLNFLDIIQAFITFSALLSLRTIVFKSSR